MKEKIKDVYFWIGLIGVIGTAMGIKLEMLTSWGILYDALVDLFSNPFKLVTVAMAIIGVIQPKRKNKEITEEDKEVA